MESKRLIIKKNYVINSSEDSTLIIPTTRENSGYLFEIDESGKNILMLLKRKTSLEKIISSISSKYPESEHKSIRKHTQQFIQKLVKLKIVEEI